MLCIDGQKADRMGDVLSSQITTSSLLTARHTRSCRRLLGGWSVCQTAGLDFDLPHLNLQL